MIDLSVQIEIHSIHQQEFLQIASDIVKNAKTEDGCVSYQLHKNMEKDYSYTIETEWKTKEAMASHIGSQQFGALLGALKFLSRSYHFNVNEVQYAGGDEIISQIRSRQIN